MSHFWYVPSAFWSGSFTSLSESFERVVRRGAVELLKVPVEQSDEILGGGVPEEGEEELRPHISWERTSNSEEWAANSRERAWNSQEEPPNRHERNCSAADKKFLCG